MFTFFAPVKLIVWKEIKNLNCTFAIRKNLLNNIQAKRWAQNVSNSKTAPIKIWYKTRWEKFILLNNMCNNQINTLTFFASSGLIGLSVDNNLNRIGIPKGGSVWQIIFTVFVTHAMMPLPLRWCVFCGIISSLLDISLSCITHIFDHHQHDREVFHRKVRWEMRMRKSTVIYAGQSPIEKAWKKNAFEGQKNHSIEIAIKHVNILHSNNRN